MTIRYQHHVFYFTPSILKVQSTDSKMWFRGFIGMKVEFPKSNWILSKQISEHAHSYTQEECQDLDAISEARAVFFCSKVDGDGPQEAVMKAFMQSVSIIFKTSRFTASREPSSSNISYLSRIPWVGTDMESKE